MTMTIQEALAHWRERLGHSIELPTPPACARLLTLAQAAGIPVGTLTIVSRPLSTGSVGTFDRASGDICCYYQASAGETGQRACLQNLLIFLASIKLHLRQPSTIEEEWHQVQQAVEEAYALAQAWGEASLFTEDDLRRLLTQTVHLALCQHAAGKLGGHRAPEMARRAYAALQASHRHRFTSEDVFAQTLVGVSHDEHLNAVVVDFDRSTLRDHWTPTSTRPAEQAASFGDLMLPRFPRSAQVLRRALAVAASYTPVTAEEALFTLDTDVPTRRVFCRVPDEQALAAVLHQVTTWFVDAAPQATLRLHTWLYGDISLVAGAAHLYRLVLTYEVGGSTSSRELWVLFADQRTLERRAIEGAWQRFLLSWLRWSDLCCDSLAEGLHALWSPLERVPADALPAR